MIKNIFIGVLVILMTLSLVYALYQKTEVKKHMQLADENAQRVVALEKQTLVQLQACQMAAEQQRLIAEECARMKK